MFYLTDYVHTTKLSDSPKKVMTKGIPQKVIEPIKINTKCGQLIFSIICVLKDEVTFAFLSRRYLNILKESINFSEKVILKYNILLELVCRLLLQ